MSLQHEKTFATRKKNFPFQLATEKNLLEHEKTSFSLQHESTFSSAARKDTFLCHTERYSSLQHEKISFAIQKPYYLQYPKINISYMKKKSTGCSSCLSPNYLQIDQVFMQSQSHDLQCSKIHVMYVTTRERMREIKKDKTNIYNGVNRLCSRNIYFAVIRSDWLVNQANCD